jgi:Tol biopolymer transport system component
VPGCDSRFQALSWFPASDALALVGHAAQASPQSPAIFVLSIGDGSARRMTSPAPSTGGDALPTVSPDGRYVAFTRSLNQYWISAEIHLLALDAERRAASAPELLQAASVHDPSTVAHEYQIAGLGWVPGRDEVLFARRGLWITPLTGRRQARLVPTPGHRPGVISVSRSGARLAFSSGSCDLDIWEIPGPANQRTERQDPPDGKPILAATTLETNPQYSPDGKRIAFSSMRTGRLQIWVADAAGTNPVRVTNSAASPGTPRWSPDGRYIAYDDMEGGNSDVYVIPAGGGPARRVTAGDSNDQVPSWSRDGRSIYFESDRTGEFQLWRTELASGSKVQVTSDGGSAAFEAPGGLWVYYGKRNQAGLWRKQVDGGPEEQVTDRGYAMSWGMYDQGICLLNALMSDVTIECMEFDSGRLSTIARFPNDGRVRPRPSGSSFAVSPDGRSILYSRVAREESDLMLVDHFDSFVGPR